MLTIFIFAIASASASDVNETAIASEDTTAIELSQSDDITVTDETQKTIQTNDTEILTASDEETTATQNNPDTLSLEEKTYADLSNAIGSGGDINLQPANYKYNGESDTITITTPGIINGNGAIIDMAGSTIHAFNVQTSGVTFKNLTIKNANYNGDGGAIYFSSSASSGTVENCNFTNNSAKYGGAIDFEGSGTVSNCNFTNNQASYEGGAIWMISGTVTNCNFTDNSATTYQGGAIRMYSGTVTNCNFTNNQATTKGGAIWFGSNGNVTNCNFTGNNATTGSAIYFYSTSATKTVSNSIFLNNRANAGALDVVKNDNNITITFTGQNNLLNAIYSREDAEVAFYNVTYWGADGITTVSAKLSGSNKEEGQNITVKGVVNGKIIDKINGTDENGEIVLDDAGDYWIIVSHKGDLYYTEIAETLFTNMKLYANVTSLTTNNKTVNITAKSNIFSEVMPGKLLFILPNGENITANYAGNGTWWAVHTFDDYIDYQVNASYVGLSNVIISNATISITRANSTVNVSDVVLNYGEAKNVTVTAEGATGITAKINDTNVTVVNNFTIPISGLAAGNYTLTVTTIADEDHNPVTKTVKITVNKAHTEILIVNETIDLKVGDETIVATLTPADAGNVTFTSSNVSVVDFDDEGNVIAQGKGQAIITVSFAGNNNYAPAENKTITVTVSLNDASVTVDKDALDLKIYETYAINATKHPDTILLDITYTSSNSSVATVDEKGIVTAVGVGSAVITVEVGDDEIYAKNSTTVKVTVSKVPTEIAADPIAATYNANKDLVITLKDSNGNPIGGLNITVDLNGTKNYTTDTNGQVKISTKGLAANIYDVLISFNGTDNYLNSSNTTTVSIYKESSRVDTKPLTTDYNVHKYLVVGLKDNEGNPIRNADASIEIHGVTYKCRSDDAGDARLIIRLNPGTYTAKITFDNVNYTGFTQYVTVIVKKLTPKLTAKKKTFKKSKKVKKYTVTLKANNKALAKVKLTLKVKGKTYKAKTNAKGKATFKIKNLKKKGKYRATVKFAGNTYYNKITKKVKITVK